MVDGYIGSTHIVTAYIQRILHGWHVVAIVVYWVPIWYYVVAMCFLCSTHMAKVECVCSCYVETM